jgi:hypothetical protein
MYHTHMSTRSVIIYFVFIIIMNIQHTDHVLCFTVTYIYIFKKSRIHMYSTRVPGYTLITLHKDLSAYL